MQVPVEFGYERAASVSDAIALLTRHGPESRLVAGGHSLIPMMKLRLADPNTLIDINDLTELTGIDHRGDHVRIGAMVRHTELLRSAVVGELFPILHTRRTNGVACQFGRTAVDLDPDSSKVRARL